MGVEMGACTESGDVGAPTGVDNSIEGYLGRGRRLFYVARWAANGREVV